MGFRGRVSRTTLADANESRDWRIVRNFAQGLIPTARQLLSRRTAGSRFRQYRLCLRFHHHRSVLDPVSVATISQT
jgi:hypothetical protein